MGEHYTRNTISVTAWCNRCQRQTVHRVDDRRLGPCTECMDRRPAKAEKPAERQSDLFQELR